MLRVRPRGSRRAQARTPLLTSTRCPPPAAPNARSACSARRGSRRWRCSGSTSGTCCGSARCGGLKGGGCGLGACFGGLSGGWSEAGLMAGAQQPAGGWQGVEARDTAHAFAGPDRMHSPPCLPTPHPPSRPCQFDVDAVADMVALKAALELSDADVAEALRERAQRIYDKYGGGRAWRGGGGEQVKWMEAGIGAWPARKHQPGLRQGWQLTPWPSRARPPPPGTLMLSTEGMSAAGLQRKATCQVRRPVAAQQVPHSRAPPPPRAHPPRVRRRPARPPETPPNPASHLPQGAVL
jgi:hypothetical protein